MARQDLGKIVSEVTSVNVTVDNNVGVPSAEASISGTLTEKELSINFKNLKGEKGDKPTKGTDYYTDQEKQEFITETNALVVAEGKKQVKELQNQGSLSIERLLKIQKEIEAILQNQEAIGNALALNGKSGPQYDKEIRSIAGGEFDSDLLFLNDAGTKTAGKLYYDKNKSGLFKCIQTTTSTVNSTTNFVDVSSLENANKLENLFINGLVNKNIRTIKKIEMGINDSIYKKGYIEARIKFNDNLKNYYTVFEIDFLRYNGLNYSKFIVPVYIYTSNSNTTCNSSIFFNFSDLNKIQVSFDNITKEIIFRVLTNELYFNHMIIKETFLYSLYGDKIKDIEFSYHVADDFPAI